MSLPNNVTRFLDSRGIDYVTATYDYDAGIHSGTEVADALDLPREQVFKTLVTESPDPMQKPVVVVIPVEETLDLKKLARALGVKKVQMVSRGAAEEMTGMQAGGISPLALINKGFVIYLDERAMAHELIYVSAGERGAQVGLSPSDLRRLTNGRLVEG